MKIIFAGTPDFAVAPLVALAKEHEVVAVYTQPDRKAGRGKKLTPPPVKQAALKLGMPVFQPASLKDEAATIASFDADVMVVVAYGLLLPQSILDIPPLGCLNIHASLLPRWRGAAPIQRALEAGDTETGVSIMRMELGLDTGPVYQMLKLSIEDTDTSLSLHDKLAELGAQGICETLRMIDTQAGTPATPQDDSLANYAKKIAKSEAELDWSKSAHELHQQIRAFIPWPVCQTSHEGTRIRIWQASVIEKEHQFDAGQIHANSDQGIEVACGKDLLRIEILQRDGSKPFEFAEFRNGYDLKTGDKLGAVTN